MEELKEVLRAEFEPRAIEWLKEIKQASQEELPKQLQDQIIITLCEAFIAGIELGGEPADEVLERNTK